MTRRSLKLVILVYTSNVVGVTKDPKLDGAKETINIEIEPFKEGTTEPIAKS